MGMCLDSTPEMGEYSVEVRRESFYLRSDIGSIFVYPETNSLGYTLSDGSCEFEIKDIPKIKAAIALVEEYLRGDPYPVAAHKR